MNNLLDILNKSVNYLEKQKVKNARLTAESIIAEIMKMERIMLYAEFERILSEDELKKIRGKLNEVVNKLKEKKISGDNNFENTVKSEKQLKLLLDKSIQYSEFEAVDEPITATLTRAASNDTYTENAFHVGYNTNSYLWKNHSVVQKFFDWLRGKDVSRENNFSKKHRVQMKVFDVNYGFYASAGIKVNMQKRLMLLVLSVFSCFMLLSGWGSRPQTDKETFFFNKKTNM